MDLRAIATPPTDDERATIDSLLGPEPAGELGLPPREADSRRHLLLPALHAIQSRFGWITPGALGYACRRLHVPPAEAYGVASFYALFALAQRPATVVHVCDDIACKARAADALIESLGLEESSIPHPAGGGMGSLAPGPSAGATAKKNGGSEGAEPPAIASMWMRSPCLGLCEQAPAALLVKAGESPIERGLGHASIGVIRDALAGTAPDWQPAAIPQRDIAGSPALRLLHRVGRVNPTSLDDYRKEGGYRALRVALDAGPTSVVREVTDSGLLGRGGAAFPTGRKWEAVARQPVRPHYLVCNADESEPGTFKDRVLMEEDPFSVIEAMTIAGFATGAEHGYLYVRAEYPTAAARIQNAIDRARVRGLLGDDIMSRGLRFDIEVRRGAGAYICGEETALFNSLEGFRGEPRSKPPFPVEVGLFGKPTVVNNVETLVNVLSILTDGAPAYRALGTTGSPGTRLFCLSGHIARPGLYEVPFGHRLDALIELAGGVTGTGRLSTVLLGGAAGTFLSPSEIGMPLTFEDTRKAGATLGSGVVLVLDDSVDIRAYLARIASFFRDESCGQCVPCRVGTVRQEELVTRLVRKSPLGSIAQEKGLLRELGQAMRDASICGLGQTASSAIESAVAKLGVLGDV